jgi:hypothetical protein
MKVSEVYSSKESKSRVYQWIRDKLNYMEGRSTKSANDAKIFDKFKREITQNIRQMILLDPIQTVELIDEKF